MKTHVIALVCLFWALPCHAVEVGDRQVVIDTLIGEAVGEGVEGMQAVAEVLRNRAEASAGRTMSQEALRPKQFSFWNDGGRAEGFLEANRSSNSILEAQEALLAALGGSRMVGEARHYYNPALAAPGWASGASGVYRVGNHVFLEGVK